MRYGDCTYEEISEYVAQGALAVVPTGCTEQQGPHLPVDFDTWFTEAVTVAAAERAEQEHGVLCLVLPALPFGPTPEHRNFGSGFVDIPRQQHEDMVKSVLVSLADQGFARIVVFRGCGEHDLSETVTRFNAERSGCVAVLPELPYHAIWNRVADPTVPGGHADSFSTSIALHLRPEAVRMDRIPGPQRGEVDWNDPNLDFHRYSDTGVIGDPTHASAALGARLWEAVVAEVAETFRTVALGD